MIARVQAATQPTSSDRRDSSAPWNPIEWSIGYWNCCARSAEIWWTRHAGAAAVAEQSRQRLAAMVRLARDRSPVYGTLYRHLPSDGIALEALPVVTKQQLMARFDDWVTDPAIRRPAVEAFLADRMHIGDRFLGRYYVWKSSGSTGVPGIYVQDAEALAIYDALVLAQVDVGRWSTEYASRMLAGNGRAALVVATGDHFASIASWQRARRANPALQAKSFSVLKPIPELVRQLNDYQPAFVASYPTVLCLLAEEQQAGRLRIAPANLWSGGECLAATAHAGIEDVFGCLLSNEYGASECLSIAYECRAGWLHVNADWVLLEAVDAAYRPVPAGEISHTALLTNLVNRVQPIIRYDLGDSLVVNPVPCTCGNPLPAVRVEGRRDEVLRLRGPEGEFVPLVPMALSTVVEEAAGLHRFQIVQTGDEHLAVRVQGMDSGPEHARAWAAVSAALTTFLDAHGLPNVTLSLDAARPKLDTPGGKLRVTVDERQRGDVEPLTVRQSGDELTRSKSGRARRASLKGESSSGPLARGDELGSVKMPHRPQQRESTT